MSFFKVASTNPRTWCDNTDEQSLGRMAQVGPVRCAPRYEWRRCVGAEAGLWEMSPIIRREWISGG